MEQLPATFPPRDLLQVQACPRALVVTDRLHPGEVDHSRPKCWSACLSTVLKILITSSLNLESSSVNDMNPNVP